MRYHKGYQLFIGISMFFIMACMCVMYLNNEEEKKETSKQDIVEVIDNTSFIDKDKDGKYKIIKEKITKENLSSKDNKSLPRDNRVLAKLSLNVNKGFNDLDTLDQYDLDNQIYIVGYYYLYANDKDEASKYINIVEKNMNEKLDEFMKKDDEISNRMVRSRKHMSIRIYVALAIGFIWLIVIGFSVFNR